MQKFTIYFTNENGQGMKSGYLKHFDEMTGDTILTSSRKECYPFDNEVACRAMLVKVRNANLKSTMKFVPLKLVV